MTPEGTRPCSQVLGSDKTPERSYLAEETVALAPILEGFRSVVSVEVWQWATWARAAGVLGGIGLFP